MGKKLKVQTEQDFPVLPDAEGSTPEKKSRKGTPHVRYEIAIETFKSGNVPEILVARFAKEMLAVDECDKNHKEAQKRRRAVYFRCLKALEYQKTLAEAAE